MSLSGSPKLQALRKAAPEDYFENGRKYNGFLKDKYMYPCDEQELDRMDIYHKFFSVARRGVLHSISFIPNHDRGPRILDIGTGSGIWAIDMADKYPQAEVIAIDLAMIQPGAFPTNVFFEQIDFELPWDGMDSDSFDLIHMRMLNGSVSSWPELYQRVFRHLKPGFGFLEHVELDLAPRCDDGSLSPTSNLVTWSECVLQATEKASRPLAYNIDTRTMLERQGFVDVKEQVIRIPLNPWSQDPHQKDIGRWYNLGLRQGLAAFSLGPLTRIGGWDKIKIDLLVAATEREISSKRYHVYHNMHIWTARRPFAEDKRYRNTTHHRMRSETDSDSYSQASTDVESVLSVAASLNSSQTSNQDQISHVAADEFVGLLFEDDILHSLYVTAIKSSKIGADKFERNLRRLLNQLSVDLRKEAQSNDQKAAANLVRSQSRYIANDIRRRIDPFEAEITYDKLREQRDKKLDGLRKVEEYLAESGIGNSAAKLDGYESNSDLESEDEFSDGDIIEPQSYENFPKLSRVKDFMVTSRAISLFRRNIYQFVYPSFETKLSRLIEQISKPRGPGRDIRRQLPPTSVPNLARLAVEWEYIAPSQIRIIYDNDRGLVNRLKCFFEDLTEVDWNWWPLAPPKRHLVSGDTRVLWLCTCGEERWEEVPVDFAKRLARILEQTPPNTTATGPNDAQTPESGSSTTQSLSLGSSWSVTAHTGSNSGTVSRKSSTMHPPSQPTTFTPNASTNTAQDGEKSAKYVILGVETGEYLRLAQIAVQDCKDDQFFQDLRLKYNEIRGILRRWFSIWRYSHCDFFEFEKIDDNDFVPLGPGVPDPGNLHYEYQPKPVKHMPPVSKHEFRRRFYACQKRCLTARTKFFGYLQVHKDRRPCRRSQEALNRIPKKTWKLEEGGDVREIFWGLYGRETISFLMVTIYHCLILLPPSIFWFLWLFRWRHPGDLQNASVPFVTALGLISLFWFPLIKK